MKLKQLSLAKRWRTLQLIKRNEEKVKDSKQELTEFQERYRFAQQRVSYFYKTEEYWLFRYEKEKTRTTLKALRKVQKELKRMYLNQEDLMNQIGDARESISYYQREIELLQYRLGEK